ncbi:MAG: hypothetical protein L6R39_001035 [Caloplaca ligustica]|nr:MAG: hypothetical protein L6R39_001035 [Caloplaca ligustica]
MHQWLHHLVKDDRQPNQNLLHQGSGGPDGEEEGIKEFQAAEEGSPILSPDRVWRLFQADGLDSSGDREFRRKSISTPNHLDKKALAALLEGLPRIANPKPAITYGCDVDSFTDEHRPLNIRLGHVAKTSDAINRSFLLVEA